VEQTVNLVTGREAEDVVRAVRERYGRIAEQSLSCCGSLSEGCATPDMVSRELGYSAEELTQAGDANLGLGCGAPLRFLDLQPGETVLDLGSGAGIDAFLAARQVGPHGRVIGVDMTPAMLARAREGAAKLGLPQVEFREGRLEALPLEDGSVDAVTSNCVINLVPDKPAVFREVARVLRPGGRLVVADIVLDGRLPEAVERDLMAYVGCIAGAAQRGDYLASLAAAGLGQIDVLSDIDYIAKLAQTAPEEVQAVTAQAGIDPAALEGIVRSLTYRARKA
jgi:SAM-dependent methyltransferase